MLPPPEIVRKTVGMGTSSLAKNPRNNVLEWKENLSSKGIKYSQEQASNLNKQLNTEVKQLPLRKQKTGQSKTKKHPRT